MTPSNDIRPLPMFDLSSTKLRPNFFREVVFWDRVPKGGLFPLAKTVRGRGLEILDLELIVSIDVNLEIWIKSHIFKTRELFPRVFPEKSIVTFINFPEAMLLDDGSLRVGSFPNL